MSVERYTPELVIEALQRTRGIKARAANILGCSRWTIDNYCSRYPEVMRAYLEEKERLLDVSEEAFYNLVENAAHKNHWDAVRFHLSTQGRDRGYGDTDVSLEQLKRQLGDITDIDMSNYTKDQLLQLKELLLIGSGRTEDEVDAPVTSEHSTDTTAAEAVKVIRSMDELSHVVAYIKGDTRKTVKDAAESRSNAIKKQYYTDQNDDA